jgi:hypothetical protein
MSSYGKRQATSPRENMPKKNSKNFETDPDLLVKIEFETINGKPYLCTVTDDELIYIWVKVFNRSFDEFFGVTSTKTLTRNVRATYKLKTPVDIKEVVDGPSFSYEKFLDDGASEVITGRIISFNSQKPAEIGDLVRVSVKTNFGVEASGILNWLKLYGTISSANPEFTINKTSKLRTDTFETDLKLRKHIEEYLPMYGQKVQVFYPGVQRMCNRCYIIGHLRRDCTNKKKDWVAYVSELVDNGSVNVELIGTWTSAITRWKSSKQTSDE